MEKFSLISKCPANTPWQYPFANDPASQGQINWPPIMVAISILQGEFSHNAQLKKAQDFPELQIIYSISH